MSATGCHRRLGAIWEQNAGSKGCFLSCDSHKGSRITKQLAEACGSRTQLCDFQIPANDDVTASAQPQLESIGVRDRNERGRGGGDRICIPTFYVQQKKRRSSRRPVLIGACWCQIPWVDVTIACQFCGGFSRDATSRMATAVPLVTSGIVVSPLGGRSQTRLGRP